VSVPSPLKLQNSKFNIYSGRYFIMELTKSAFSITIRMTSATNVKERRLPQWSFWLGFWRAPSRQLPFRSVAEHVLCKCDTPGRTRWSPCTPDAPSPLGWSAPGSPGTPEALGTCHWGSDMMEEITLKTKKLTQSITKYNRYKRSSHFNDQDPIKYIVPTWIKRSV